MCPDYVAELSKTCLIPFSIVDRCFLRSTGSFLLLLQEINVALDEALENFETATNWMAGGGGE